MSYAPAAAHGATAATGAGRRRRRSGWERRDGRSGESWSKVNIEPDWLNKVFELFLVSGLKLLVWSV